MYVPLRLAGESETSYINPTIMRNRLFGNEASKQANKYGNWPAA